MKLHFVRQFGRDIPCVLIASLWPLGIGLAIWTPTAEDWRTYQIGAKLFVDA